MLQSENENLRAELSVTRTVTAARFADIANHTKPNKLNGVENEFADCDFGLSCFMGAMAPELISGMNVAASSADSASLATRADMDSASQLYNILAMCTGKAARKVVRMAPDQNGFEAYERLARKFWARDEHDENSTLMGLLKFHFGNLGNWTKAWIPHVIEGQGARWHTGSRHGS